MNSANELASICFYPIRAFSGSLVSDFFSSYRRKIKPGDMWRGVASLRYRTRAERHRSYVWTEAMFAGVRPGFHKKIWVIRLRGYSMNMAKSNLKMYTGPGFLFKLVPLLAWESSRHLATPSQVPAKWRLSNDCSNSVLHGDVHYPDLCDAADWSHCERNLF